MRAPRGLILSFFAVVSLAGPALAASEGDDVEFTSGAVTATSCALKAKKTGNLAALNSCPLSEAKTGIVVFDVAEKEFYRLDPKKVARYKLERAFAGGSIDVSGKVKRVGKDGVPELQVAEYSITPRPKPGAFKGCL
jgi:hypothetical protein